jgi:hypothetical protein
MLGSLPNAIRRLWYRLDPLFEDNEAAIDLRPPDGSQPSPLRVRDDLLLGSLAFLLVYNSLVFRVPAPMKRIYAPALLRLEGLIERVQTKRSSCIVICQWRKLS